MHGLYRVSLSLYGGSQSSKNYWQNCRGEFQERVSISRSLRVWTEIKQDGRKKWWLPQWIYHGRQLSNSIHQVISLGERKLVNRCGDNRQVLSNKPILAGPVSRMSHSLLSEHRRLHGESKAAL